MAGRMRVERKETVYFDDTGPQNTADCVRIACDRVKQGVRHVVVASTTGETGLKFARALEGTKTTLVSVAISTGWRGPNIQALDEAARAKMESMGVKVHVGTIPTDGLEAALAKSYQGVYPSQIVAETLWRFGHGTKVAVEVVMMACDAGLVPEGEDVLGVGGTNRGSDAVLLIKSAATRNFQDLKVLEILAKPREG